MYCEMMEHNCMALTENYILISLFAATTNATQHTNDDDVKKIVYYFFVLDNEDVTSMERRN
jgi:hypothetical protein